MMDWELTYDFDWNQLGNLEMGRANLGTDMPVIVYRLMQMTMKRVMDADLGLEQADSIMQRAGFIAGHACYKNLMIPETDFNAFVSQLQNKMRDLKIGILRIEKADLEKMELTLTVSEDLDCSGLPVVGDTVCVYDEGFIAGILYGHTGKVFAVKEIDCWATGDRTCRFTANLI